MSAVVCICVTNSEKDLSRLLEKEAGRPIVLLIDQLDSFYKTLNVYQSHDSGISSNGFYASPSGLGTKVQRGEGDGSEEYHLNSTLPKVYEKYPLEPPELPPRDYTTDEDNLDGKKYLTLE